MYIFIEGYLQIYSSCCIVWCATLCALTSHFSCNLWSQYLDWIHNLHARTNNWIILLQKGREKTNFGFLGAGLRLKYLEQIWPVLGCHQRFQNMTSFRDIGWQKITKIAEQAGLSRATLEISSRFSYNFLCEKRNIPLLIFLKSSSVRCCSHFKYFEIHFGYLSICFKFWWDPTSGYWDIPLSFCGGRLPLEIVFMWNISKVWFGHLSLSFKFG